MADRESTDGYCVYNADKGYLVTTNMKIKRITESHFD